MSLIGKRIEKEDEATVIVNATLQLISSLSCPPSSLSFARRLMSSTIGSDDGRSRQERHGHHHLPSLLKSILRCYRRKCLAQSVEEGDNSSNHPWNRNKNANIEQHVTQVMHKVELLFGRLERLSDRNTSNNGDDKCWKWMVLYSRLAGTCPKQKHYKQQQNNLKYLHAQVLRQNEKSVELNEKVNGFNVNRSMSHDHAQSKPIQYKITENSMRLNQKAKEKATIHQMNMLLRECIFALQGLDGESIRFLWHKSHQEGVRIRPGICAQISNNPTMVMDAIRICGECGWLYLRIQSYIQAQHVHTDSNNGSMTGGGVVNRALCAALTKELGEYHRLLAIFESQLRNPNKVAQHIQNSSLTLRRLLVWLREPTQRLQVLATVADGVQTLRGGQLADALHLHATNHGDPMVRTLLYNIVSASTIPLYRMLRNWVMEGTLPNDSFREFFIVECTSNTMYQKDSNTNRKQYSSYYEWDNEKSSENIWDGKYDLNMDMLPRFIGEELAYEAFIVGKGINFIRLCLDDPSWRISFDDENKSISSRQTRNSGTYRSTNNNHQENLEISFHYGNEDILFQTLHFASHQIHSHILASLIGPKHRIMDHLLGLKRLLLLGQGDFVAALLEGIHVELDKPASRVYIHNLNAIFDNALRSTNARFLPTFVLDKVQVKLMKKSDVVLFSNKNTTKTSSNTMEEEDSGWDIFSLDYNVQAPLTAIVHSQARKQYRRIFHLLWKLKQIEWALNKSWKRANILNHALWQYLSQYNTTKESEKSGKSAMFFLNKTATTRRAMLHFVSNLQSYLLYEVIEGGWKTLVQSIQKAQSLDEFIESHDMYLSEITSKSLLQQTSSGSLALQLALIFDKCSEFCAWQNSVLQTASTALHDARQKRTEAERRTAAGLWGYDTKKDEVDDDVKFFNSLSDPKNVEEVNIISNEFNTVLMKLINMIHSEINSTTFSSEEISPGKTNPVEDLTLKYDGKRRQHIVESSSPCEIDDALRFLAFRLDFSDYYNKLDRARDSI